MKPYITVVFTLAGILSVNATIASSQEPSPAGLASLEHGFYYQTQQGWKKMEAVTKSGISTKHGASSLAGVPPGAVFNYADSAAPNQFENRRPIFGIRLDTARPDIPGTGVRDLLIVRVSQKRDHRELQVVRGRFASMQTGISSRDVVETTLTAATDQTYTFVPKNDLKPGEYLITFRGSNGNSGYDFGIK